ncbi:MAG: hypothetical protein LBH10_03080 [Burkholderiaceae bacterium]|jgi:hypothetical protein|nr:hypothetical protein [Burkholderiaceae bacterium]
MNNIDVTVHSFEKYSISEDDYIKSKRKGTEDAIRRLGGRVIPGTAIKVPKSGLDGNDLTVPSVPDRPR